MKKKLLIATCFASMIFVLSACSGVKQEEYDAVTKELASTKKELESVSTALEALQIDHNTLVDAYENYKKQVEAAEEEKAAKAAEGAITKEKYDAITDAMSYEEVIDIIGSEGELKSEVGSPGDGDYVASYAWINDGSSATFIFKGNKLINKAHNGLK